ncbi:hypothetical protein CWS43_03970 [Rahnella sp. AA]|nr:hypothetical protein CWS43_03970 [Rahnella sp. AA]
MRIVINTRHTSIGRCVGYVHSPESLTSVSSSGLVRLPPSCHSNYLGYQGKWNARKTNGATEVTP